ncbi:DUF3885 domain-containing protein [Candidatus Gracilibacteria bacterium]|nr:DUF3885 domain-containing protein [Candidatus Gracilibacteria bacterium]
MLIPIKIDKFNKLKKLNTNRDIPDPCPVSFSSTQSVTIASGCKRNVIGEIKNRADLLKIANISISKHGLIVTKEFGRPHGEKLYKKGKTYYSIDNTYHNGGVFKVFDISGGKLRRIGTADKDLNIFKKSLEERGIYEYIKNSHTSNDVFLSIFKGDLTILKKISKALLEKDFSVDPVLYLDSYYFDIDNGFVFNLYDDRGLDILSQEKDVLKRICKKLNDKNITYQLYEK